jgi:protein-tyrosine phosphatase
MVEMAPNMYRMGQPTPEGWVYIKTQVDPKRPVLVVKLNDAKEGDDSTVLQYMNWYLDQAPLPPEDDQIWTIFVKPDPKEVTAIVKMIVQAYQGGWTVIWHCSHGRDRTGLIAALVGMKLFGWTKDQAWSNMLAHGFRWELPDLLAYWIEDVQARPLPKRFSKLN